MTHKMLILNQAGHTTLEWDVAEERTVEEVEAEFNRLVVANGMLAYTTVEKGKGSQIKEFDPTAETIYVTPRLVGG